MIFAVSVEGVFDCEASALSWADKVEGAGEAVGVVDVEEVEEVVVLWILPLLLLPPLLLLAETPDVADKPPEASLVLPSLAEVPPEVLPPL